MLGKGHMAGHNYIKLAGHGEAQVSLIIIQL